MGQIKHMPTPVTRTACAREIIALRHAVLRPGFDVADAVYPEDDDPTTLHFGCFEADRCVACVTLLPSELDSEPAYQLRGMASAPDRRGQGLGAALLDFTEQHVITRTPIRLLWCNARTSATGFYQHHGWRIISDQFEIPTVGPHFRMCKQLT
ncbi:GNAT family N-acetyltransferase [Planctomycetales bacterium ZRK34]|nr:GNAT family N-acetyltransferase [Planctomycetales bacterium ZRK34]